MRIYPTQPFLPIENDFGFWGEISAVHTEGRAAPSANAGSKYRFYGGLVFHVIEAVTDEAGLGWYKVVDDYPPRQSTNHQWVLGAGRAPHPASRDGAHPPFRRRQADRRSISRRNGSSVTRDPRSSTRLW